MKITFRYLQGYMGTSSTHQSSTIHHYLDTFKDIWGHDFTNSRACCYVFRYLQGYMGTYHNLGGDMPHWEFRYLQGYMGTVQKHRNSRKIDVI